METSINRISSQKEFHEIPAPPLGVTLPEHAEIILREMEDKYRSFFENIEQGYYEVDIHGNFTFFNDFICRIFGYPKDELMGVSFKKFIDREIAKRVYQTFNKVYTTGKPETGLIFEVTRKDGAKRQIGASVCIMQNAAGKRTGFRGIARDISERKIMESQLKQAQKLESIGQLAAGIAHEINTPIQYTGENIRFLLDAFKEIDSVLGKYRKLFKAIKAGSVTEGIIREVESTIERADLDFIKEELPKAIEQSLEGVDRVAKIVLAMKEFSHPGTEDKKTIDINMAIQSTITIARNEWKYMADMETEFDSSLPPVPCLPGEFNQVILNLIINAAHSIADNVGVDAKEKGTIKVSTRFDAPWAEIRISDTGVGIPKNIRSRIFDPFFTTKEVGRGSGQGLAICYSVIVNKHGGKIEFETEMEKGTTFIIRLPVEIENE